MSDSSRTELYLVKETTWGEVPSGPPTLQTMRVTGESLTQTQDTIESQEIRADRQSPGVFRVDRAASGDVNFELSYGAGIDDLLEGTLQTTWAADVSNTGISLTVTASTQTMAGTGLAAGLNVGDWFELNGSSSNDGYYRIATKASDDSITVEQATAELTDEGPTGSCELAHDGIAKNGTTFASYVIEKKFDDITEFLAYRGMAPTTLNLNHVPGALITGSFSFLGKDCVPAGATVGDGSPTAAPTNEVMTGVADVYQIREGGSLSTLDVTNLSFTFENNLRSLNAIANLGAVALGSGRISLTGTLEAYFADRTDYEKFTNFTESGLSWVDQDAAGNAYIWTIPKLRYTEATVVAGAIDQDVMLSMGFTAYLDTNTKTLSITRIDAA